MLVGDDPFALESIGERLEDVDGQAAAKATLDAALHHWIGKRLGLPLWRLLGLAPDAPPTSYTIGIDTLEGTRDRARRARDFKALKVKVGGAEDLERLYWGAIAERHGLDLTVVNPLVDPTWRFMTLDWDEKIRMDCSSPSAMASLIGRKDEYQIATGNDADADRHGIVTPDAGLMNPNHFLAVAIGYLFGGNRPDWPATARIGKTLVSSSMIDRVAASLDKPMVEVPVGFKWFVPGLIDGSFGFGGEESAGASFLRRDGSTWTTDKDGLILCLLASEILAVSGNTPSELYQQLVSSHGDPAYARVDAPANRDQKAKLAALSPDDVSATMLAGEEITAKLTEAPGNGAKIGGLKVVTENAWFAARPSGTEDVYKIYAESFKGRDHLAQVQEEAREVVSAALG